MLALYVHRVAHGAVEECSTALPNQRQINYLINQPLLVPWVHSLRRLRAEAKDRGPLNTTLSNPAVPDAVAVPAPKKRGWLPLLTALFLLSYALMTMLIVEQGRTIDSQRFLIRQLFQDSSELSASKIKALQQHNQAAQAQAPATQNPSAQAPTTQAPSSHTPSTQAPSKQAPSSQAAPQHRTQNEQKNQKQFQMPSRPASELAEEGRALVRI